MTKLKKSAIAGKKILLSAKSARSYKFTYSLSRQKNRQKFRLLGNNLSTKRPAAAVAGAMSNSINSLDLNNYQWPRPNHDDPGDGMKTAIDSQMITEEFEASLSAQQHETSQLLNSGKTKRPRTDDHQQNSEDGTQSNQSATAGMNASSNSFSEVLPELGKINDSNKQTPMSSNKSSGATPKGSPPNTETQPPLRPTKYPDTNEGPFEVFIENEKGAERKGVHPTTVGRLLSTNFKGFISSIRSAGANKVKVILSNREKANALITSNLLKINKYRASIPASRLSRQALIRGVPLDLPIDEITSEIKVNEPSIASARRLSRKVIVTKEGKSTAEYKPTGTILLTFESQSAPTSVKIYYTSYITETYVSPVKMCFKCLRFGHLRQHCRGEELCLTCDQKKSSHTAENPCCHNQENPMCANCRGAHSITDRRCPEFQYQQKIHHLAAEANITLGEATEHLLISYPPTHSSRHFRKNSEKFSNKDKIPEALNNKTSFPHLTDNTANINSTPPHYSAPTTVSYSGITNTSLSTPPQSVQKRVFPASKSQIPPQHRESLINPNGRIPNMEFSQFSRLPNSNSNSNSSSADSSTQVHHFTHAVNDMPQEYMQKLFSIFLSIVLPEIRKQPATPLTKIPGLITELFRTNQSLSWAI